MRQPGGTGAVEVCSFTAGLLGNGIAVHRTDGSPARTLFAPGIGTAILSSGSDADGDGRHDLVFAFFGGCALLSSRDGRVLGGTSLPGVRELERIADLDRDGRPETLIVGRSTIEVRSGADFRLLIGFDLEAQDVDAADVDGDGVQELLAITPAGDLRVLSCEPFGNGCVGSNGTPLLLPASGPALTGRSYRLAATNLPNPTGTCAGFHVTGWRSTWNGQPLPVDLGVLGWPGCLGYSSGENVVFFTGANGSATLDGGVPSTATLGSTRTDQVLVADPSIPRGASASNAVRSTIASDW